jgi:hypothetical protein
VRAVAHTARTGTSGTQAVSIPHFGLYLLSSEVFNSIYGDAGTHGGILWRMNGDLGNFLEAVAQIDAQIFDALLNAFGTDGELEVERGIEAQQSA